MDDHWLTTGSGNSLASTAFPYDVAIMSTPARQEHLIFVSHSGEDTWVARQIANAIRDVGGTPFLDVDDVDTGVQFEDEIRLFLDRAHELVVLFTPWSLDRPYVWMEIGAAWLRGIPVIVILHGIRTQDFLARPNLPTFVKARDLMSLNEIDTYLGELSDRTTMAADP